MKIRTVAIAALAMALIGGGMAYAQAPNPRAQAEFERWVNTHPALERNPGLMHSPQYLASHPNFANFLKAHPYVNREALQNYGAWGPNHQWHNRNWWMQNNPNWVQQNRPIWNQPASAFGNPYGNRDGDGDWDEGHHWHKRQWWMHHRREWAEQHHPGWFQGGPGRGPEGEGPRGNAWGYGHGHGPDHDNH